MVRNGPSMAMSQSLCKGRRSTFGRLIVWVRTASMVGRIDDLSDAGHLLRDQCLNALFQRHICHATALAPATQGNIGNVFFNIKEDHVPSMIRQSRVDVLVKELLDGNILGIGPLCLRIMDPETALFRSLHEVQGGPLQIGRTLSVNKYPEAASINHDIIR